MPPRARKPTREWRLAGPEYAISTPDHRRGLVSGRRRFAKILGEQLAGAEIPDRYRSKWVISRDFGQLRELWQLAHDFKKKDIYAPIVGHDILLLQEAKAGRPLPKKPGLFLDNETIVNTMMHPKDAYAFPVRDRRGNHLATVIHVGPEASDARIRRLARKLISDPIRGDSPV